MKFEMAPTTMRAGVIGAVVAAILTVVSSFIPFLGCLLAPIGFIVPFAIGAYSVMLGRQAGRPAGNTAQDGVDGGIAGAIAGVVNGLVGGIFVLLGVGPSAMMSGDAGSAAVAGMVGITAAVSGICFGLFIGGILAAIGGVIYGMVMKK